MTSLSPHFLPKSFEDLHTGLSQEGVCACKISFTSDQGKLSPAWIGLKYCWKQCRKDNLNISENMQQFKKQKKSQDSKKTNFFPKGRRELKGEIL